MINNSRQSQRGSSDDTIDIISLISDVDLASIDLIGQQQQAQIDSLKVQVQSLENELSSRNEESLLIKKRISQTSITINQIVQSLLNSIDKEEQEKINILKKIKNEKNSYNKIDQYISFIYNYTESNLESFNRICDQLRNHIQLIELLNSETNLPLSTSSQPNYQQILLNEAHKTNEFIKNSIQSSYSQNEIIPPISELLNINNFSPEGRYEKVQSLIYGIDIPIDELKALLLQEIAITDVLRKYITSNLSQIPAEITNNLTEKIRIETENELRPKIEQEFRLKYESEQQQYTQRLQIDQKWQRDQNAQKIQELQNEIERLKKSAKDDLINEIGNETDSELRKKIVSMLRGEIEADVRSKIRNEDLINSKFNKETNQYSTTNQSYGNYKNDYQNYQESLQNIKNQQQQEYENRLQKELQAKEMQLRSQFNLELQQQENQIKAQLRSQYDLDLQQNESQIRKQLRSQFDLELQQKENQIQTQLRSQYDLDLQQKESQIRKQLRSQFDLELQQKENQIQAQLRSQYDLDLQQNESQIRKQLRSQFDSELQQKENQIQTQLRSQYDLDLQQKESQIRKQLRSQFDLELQQKENQIRNKLEPQIRAEIMNQVSKNSTESRPNSITNNFNENFNDQNTFNNELRASYNQPINDQYLVNLYTTLCDALGVIPISSQMNINLRKSENYDYRSNPLLSSILDHSMSLASGILKLRSHISYNQKGRFNFLSRFEELENQVAHLDQLHTQTRALLIKQSQIISDLRLKTGSASWISWARNLYKVLNSSDFDASEEEDNEYSDVSSSFSFKKGAVNVLDPDYTAELKLAIEEKAVAIMAKERMRSLRSET